MKSLSAFNFNWKFYYEGLTDNAILAKDKDYDDSNWENITIPHDWSIMRGYDKEKGDGATGYLLGGVGWYRKHFTIEEADLSNKTLLYFDGVYNICTIYINGKEIATHHYGYSPFTLDLTGLCEKENVLSVKVDHSRYVDSRWYPGSGIYRKVSLTMYPETSINPTSMRITSTPQENNGATVEIQGCIDTPHPNQPISINYVIIDPSHHTILNQTTDVMVQKSDNDTNFTLPTLSIDKAQLWSVETPHLYTLNVYLNGQIAYTSHFGIRSLRFDPNEGFFLNGQNMKIQGVCLHHDAGLVGSAVPKDVWKRRFTKLKELGCNAIRTSHNPASSDFLDLCDSMGLLVQEEFFDEWDYPKDKRDNGGENHGDELSRGFNQYFEADGETELKNTIRCHYNHPSIFQWSIGNEIEWTYKGNREATGFFDSDATGNYFWTLPPHDKKTIHDLLKVYSTDTHKIGDTAQLLSSWVKEIDTTRPVIANCILPSASFESGYADALDIVGFSYRRVMYDYAHKNYPAKVCMGCENVGQYHEWKAIEERPFMSGTFLWTGIDYIGEAHRDTWPRKGTQSGLLDLAAFTKPAGHMYKSLWNKEPELYLATQTEEKSFYQYQDGKICEKKGNRWDQRLWVWPEVHNHWNYQNNERCIVEAYSNCEEIELFLNKQSLGKKYLKDFEDHIYTWAVTYQAGTLKAIGTMADGTKAYYTLETAGTADHIALFCDTLHLRKGTDDCCHLIAEILDAKNHPVQNSECDIAFEIEGACRILGVDNGSVDNVTRPLDMHTMTNQGKAMCIIEAGCTTTSVSVKVYGVDTEDLLPSHLHIEID